MEELPEFEEIKEQAEESREKMTETLQDMGYEEEESEKIADYMTAGMIGKTIENIEEMVQ